MSKARFDIAPQFLRAEKTRQRYLEFFAAHPGSTAAELRKYMTATFGDARSTCNSSRQMIDLGELRAVKTERIWRYYATATVTTSAKSFSDKQRTAARRKMDERHGNDPDAHTETETTPPWLYRHKPGKKVISGGGQGCVRPRVFVGSSDRV